MSNKDAILKAIEETGLTIESEFVPFSRSRNKDEDNRSLNWRVTLKCEGGKVLTTDYMAGIAHCPSYKQGDKCVDHAEAIKHETETGYSATGYRQKILPETVDVIYCLVSDADVLNYPDFEDWAGNMGYDTDSRKAEKIYNSCRDLAIKLVSALRHDKLEALQTLYVDY